MERGLLYMTDDDTPSALSEAGYLRPDQRSHRECDRLPAPPDVANPVVRQALFEVRKVVNAIVREYGKPARIHVELARNAKASAEERKKISRQMRARQEERDRAAEEIRDRGHAVSRDAIDRYLLWQEQDEHCVYCLKAISPAQLLGGEADIDHILPHSRCIDKSFQNKVVVCVSCNRQGKGNQTPYEWLADRDPQRYERTLDLDKFAQRQLNDTRYISRSVLQYLRCLLDRPHNALAIRGETTSELRLHWGLNRVLRHDDLELKNREDHRHHAVDAMVVALTNQSRLQQLAGIGRSGGTARTGEILPEPWKGFHAEVEGVVNAINASHRPSRKVGGALHEDTFYGRTAQDGVHVIRKPLEALTTAMVSDIRNPVIREIVSQRLTEHGLRVGRRKRGDSEKAGGRTIPKEVWQKPLAMPSGVAIRKVRVLKEDKTILPLRDGTASVKPGSIHHVCLFEWEENGKRVRDAVFVSMLEAMKRLKRHEPLIQRHHPSQPDARFLMSLSRGEMVLGRFKNQQRLVVYVTSASTTQQFYFASHTDARRDYEKFSVKPSTFDGRKVSVDLLGRLRWASD
jgi:CRISPR-associated endonuclease Csn1